MLAAGRTGRPRAEVAVFVGALLGIVVVISALTFSSYVPPNGSQTAYASPQGLGAFESYSQLQAYIAANAKSAQQYNRYGVSFGGGLPVFMGGLQPGAIPMAAAASAVATPAFTQTNVQVQGVDEPDRIKTDGVRLFVSNGNAVTVINAYPPSAASILSTISLPKASVLGLEISQDRLMVITQNGYNVGRGGYAPYVYQPSVGLLLYDVSSPASPKLIENVSVPGNYVAARLADGYLYAVIQQPSYIFDNNGNATAVMPSMVENGAKTPLAPSQVYYTPNRMQISFYTMIESINMTTGKNGVVSVLTGPSATIFVSPSNIYVVYTNYLDFYGADGIPGNVFTGGIIASGYLQRVQNSTIVRASYSLGLVSVAAAGIVPGTVLNQFSMDEYNGYFRVATSRFAMIGGSPTRSDDVYVLDKSMGQVSALRNIAPGENIYAVRFVGGMGYVVTFEQIDPLFVISFKDVANPVILSDLKVNGYSDYLHPLPGGYLIGVGKDAVPSSTGNFAWYLGLKLSLFRVFDNGSAIQVSKLLIGDRGTNSPVLTDHLAFTFDSTRNVIVIPVTLAVVSGTQNYGPNSPPPYGEPVWQGVYVIKVDSSGFTVLGKVSQYAGGQSFGSSPNLKLQIDRSAVIGDFVYTVSQGEVMVSLFSAPSFPTVATIQLPA